MFERFIDLISGSPLQTGLVADDPAWLASLPHHELFGSANTIDDALLGLSQPSWRTFAPPFRWQQPTMMCSAFAAANMLAMLNARETGQIKQFSPTDIYWRAKGEIYGNTVQNTINALKEGVLLEEDCPWPNKVVLDFWGATSLALLNAYSEARAVGKDSLRPTYAIKGVTSVVPSRDGMRRALTDSPLLAVVNVGRGWFDSVAPRVEYGSAHLVVITKVFDNDRIEIMDSLTNTSSSFNGFRILENDFDVLYAFGVLDLPNDWRQTQEAEIESGRYGKPINLSAERSASFALLTASQKNPTHAAMILRNNRAYVLAISYGGYSLQDVLNSITSVRRGNGPIFDFSKPHP